VLSPVYLDSHATTPLASEALQAMLPFLEGLAGNPLSPHAAGEKAHAAVERARSQIAALVGARPGDVILTASATEANNLLLRGLISSPDRRRIVSSAVEHPSVLEPLRQLQTEGWDVRILPVDAAARIDLDELADCVDERTALVSVALANGEIGSTERISEIVSIAHQHGALMHSDASQAAGRIPIDLDDLGVDALTVSAHKLHGPQGVGALVARASVRRLLQPLLLGGGQERGLRSGTSNVAGAVGFGAAAEVAHARLTGDTEKIRRLASGLLAELQEQLEAVELNGPWPRDVPHNLNVRIVGADAEALMANCPDVCMSAGSACSAGSPEPSPVLTATGLDRTAASESLRLGLSRMTTEDEVARAAAAIAQAARRLRRATAVGAGAGV
jgi:cysteine desulfurase